MNTLKKLNMNKCISNQIIKQFSSISVLPQERGLYNHYENDPNKNRYQETQMLFFQDKKKQKQGLANSDLTRPRTIQEIKKL